MKNHIYQLYIRGTVNKFWQTIALLKHKIAILQAVLVYEFQTSWPFLVCKSLWTNIPVYTLCIATTMIPIVDMKDCAISISNDALNETCKAIVAKEICDAFKSVGFVYLKNFGMSSEKVSKIILLLNIMFVLCCSINCVVTSYRQCFFAYAQATVFVVMS